MLRKFVEWPDLLRVTSICPPWLVLSPSFIVSFSNSSSAFRIATLSEDAEISASSRQRMIQDMAMLEAKVDEFSAKLREAEDKCAESERARDAHKREFEVRLESLNNEKKKDMN